MLEQIERVRRANEPSKARPARSGHGCEYCFKPIDGDGTCFGEHWVHLGCIAGLLDTVKIERDLLRQENLMLMQKITNLENQIQSQPVKWTYTVAPESGNTFVGTTVPPGTIYYNSAGFYTGSAASAIRLTTTSAVSLSPPTNSGS